MGIRFVTRAAEFQSIDSLRVVQRKGGDRSTQVVKYCRIEYADNAVFCGSGSSPTIEHCTLRYNGIGVVWGGVSSPLIRANSVVGNSGGIGGGYGFPTIDSNIIASNSYTGINISGQDSACVTENAIDSNGHEGVCLGAGRHLLSHNSICGNARAGIYAFQGVQIVSNTIRSNDWSVPPASPGDRAGIVVCGGPVTITGNCIDGNRTGIRFTERPRSDIVTQNDIESNTEYEIVNSTTTPISLPNNWWGTTDTDSIDAAIYDFNDDFALGQVSYKPIATQPFPNAGRQ